MKKYWLIAGLLTVGCSGGETQTSSTPDVKTETPAQAKPIKKHHIPISFKAPRHV